MTTSNVQGREILPVIEKAGLGNAFFGAPTSSPPEPPPAAAASAAKPATPPRSTAPNPTRPRRSAPRADGRSDYEDVGTGSVTAYVPPEIATRFRDTSRGVGLSQAVVAGRAVAAVSIDAIMDYCRLESTTGTTDMPGARRISSPRDAATLQIRMRPDQHAWLEAKKPAALDHLPTSRWLGAAITLYLQDKVSDD